MPIVKPAIERVLDSLSLTNVFREMVIAAEQLCGPADRTFELCGIDFLKRESPFLRIEEKNLWIELPEGCQSHQRDLVHQLAHEYVHTLRPGDPSMTTNLEEGLAEHFAQTFLWSTLGMSVVVPEPYEAARSAVERLLHKSGASFRQMMHNKCPRMSPMDASHLAGLDPRPTDDEISFLVNKLGGTTK